MNSDKRFWLVSARSPHDYEAVVIAKSENDAVRVAADDAGLLVTDFYAPLDASYSANHLAIPVVMMSKRRPK